MKAYPKTHQQGVIEVNCEAFGSAIKSISEIVASGNPVSLVGHDLGIQIAEDGRIWVCIDGITFIRFRPTPAFIRSKPIKTIKSFDEFKKTHDKKTGT
jgi:hypothetical protein